MSRTALAILLLLSAAGSLSAQEDVLNYRDSAGFFGQGRANRHYEYTCPFCHKGFNIPTGSYSDASQWVAIHKKACGGGRGSGPASDGGTWQDAANRAMVEGIKHRDGQLFAMGAGAHLFNGLLTGLMSSTNNSADLEREREFRAAEERRRLEEIARREEMERVARIARAAGFREEWDRRDAEMTQSLGGVFDVVSSRKSTPFFGEPVISDAPADPVPVAATSTPAPSAPAPIYSSDVVVLGSDTLTVNPDLLRQGAVRAKETRTAIENLSRWEIAPDPRTQPDSPRLEALKKLGGLMQDDVRDALIEHLEVPGLSQAVTTYTAVKGFSEDLFKKLGDMDLRDPNEVEKWRYASEELGSNLLRDAYGEHSRKQQSYYEVFDQLWSGVKR